ncbi:sensor histidine kinase [Brevibacillus formosus]|uniref:sensor histidine kinase n=1 Tax=Brevibacillus formosus TaxID=54913 RepID=UPI001C67EBD3|nr:HAMP domain-containing sensor histidine kinase [Brevibacillus formosus]MBW5469506.1 sensor histidine kinase [Brevibacillus formosus]
MKWRLTGRFLASVVLIVIMVTVMNLLLVLGLYLFQGTLYGPIFIGKEGSVEAVTRGFQQHLLVSGNQVAITEEGKSELIQHNAWIQVLDENGQQIYTYRVPNGLKEKYTPLEIIQMYKYIEINPDTTVFIGEKRVSDRAYSYFMGFANPSIHKKVVSYDSREINRFIEVGSMLVLVGDGLVALFIGYLFSKRLTKPMLSLIEGIKRLANKDYHVSYEQKGIYKDVFTNVNRLADELKASEKERMKLDQMKEEWIGNISHDIKTPLASIQGYAEMLKDDDYDFSREEMREYAAIIERKALYLKEVIEDLNLSTRLKNKELVIRKTPGNLVTLLRNVVIDTWNDTRHSDENIEFVYSEEIMMMEMDETLMKRAISNLIYNSIVHNEEDVRIKVSLEKKQRILITIEDNGKGIKQEELVRIFDRYYRGTNTGQSHKGSGLGMAIAHDIVVAHGGEISVKSRVGQGTRIEIML